MSVRSDVLTLGAMELVEMFEYNDTNIKGTTVFRWHSGTKPAGNLPIVWAGKTYEPFPIEAAGFDINSAGRLPRPTLRASNIGGNLGAYLRTMQDALGAKVTRKRTLGKYLDAVNFAGGNPYADPTTGFPDEIYYIARKASETALFIEMELAVPFDVEGVMLPRYQVLASTCQWVYRSAACSYAGPAVKTDPVYPDSDATTTTDKCGKTLAACKKRFGNGTLRTSAFPASVIARYT